MIQLVRPAEPVRLVANRKKWTERWERIFREQRKLDWATKTAKHVLREPLLQFSKQKCAFCEGILNLTSYLEIEHYHAKTVRPGLVFEWQNLFPACGICNGNKSKRDHGGILVKPDRDNPELLLWLDFGTGKLEPHPTLDHGQIHRVNETIQAYNLQRGALCNQRIEMVKRVNRWLSRAAQEAVASVETQEEWQDLIHPCTPWKFVIRHVLTTVGKRPELAEIDRRAFLQEFQTMRMAAP